MIYETLLIISFGLQFSHNVKIFMKIKWVSNKELNFNEFIPMNVIISNIEEKATSSVL